MLERIDEWIVATFERLEVTAEGVDWDRAGLRGPSSTWTYLIDDKAFAGNVMRTLSGSTALGLWAVILTWPLLLAWGLLQHWRRWRAGRHRLKGGHEPTEVNSPS